VEFAGQILEIEASSRAGASRAPPAAIGSGKSASRRSSASS
jgi:hypothetical protein